MGKKKCLFTELRLMANTLRQDIIKMLLEAKSGHPGGSLDLADIITALYFHVLNHDPKNPDWTGRDRLVLSAGHLIPIQYAAMARSGYFPLSELKTFRKLNSRLQGHPALLHLHAIENSSGSDGQGTSVAIGMALAARMNNHKHHVFCITSDGEQQEGQVWEAQMFAGNYKLDNLTFILDRNDMQIDGDTKDVMYLDPLRAKYEAFNWHVVEINGNDVEQVVKACELAKTIHTMPTMIIAYTTPGKGVDFMENDYRWHGSSLNEQQSKDALKQLQAYRKRIVLD